MFKFNCLESEASCEKILFHFPDLFLDLELPSARYTTSYQTLCMNYIVGTIGYREILLRLHLRVYIVGFTQLDTGIALEK